MDISSAGTYFYAIRNSLTHAREVFTNPLDEKNKHVESLITDEECFKGLIKCTLKLVHYTYLEIVEHLRKQK